MIRVRFDLWTATYLVCSTCAFAQEQPSVAPVVQPNPKSGSNVLNIASYHSLSNEFWLTCLICFVGLTVIAILTWSVLRMEQIRPEDLTRPIIVITIIFGTLVLVTAGYSNEQIAPAYGLFGTIVGYILGRMSQPPRPDDPNQSGDKVVRPPAEGK